MPRLELFPFRYRESFMGKWVKARYRSERHEIAARYKQWEITAPPEIREVDPKARYFTPWKVLPHVELMRMEEPAPELQPHLAGPPAIDELKTVLGDAIPPMVRHILRGAGTLLADAGRFAATRGDYKTLPESLAQEVHQVQPLVGGLDLLVRVE